MPKRHQTILLPVSSAEALAACRRTLRSLGWEATEPAENRIVGDEEPWRLDCHTSPSRIEIGLSAEAADRTAVEVTVAAPGFGPRVSRRLARQIEAFEEKVAAADDGQL